MSSREPEAGEEDTGSGHDAFGAAQRDALQRAIRLEWITLAWMTGTVVHFNIDVGVGGPGSMVVSPDVFQIGAYLARYRFDTTPPPRPPSR